LLFLSSHSGIPQIIVAVQMTYEAMEKGLGEPIREEVFSHSTTTKALEFSLEGSSNDGLAKEIIENARISAYTKFDAGVNCISASQKNICWTEKNICACPSRYDFGTKFLINGEEWTCVDRMAPSYRVGDNFDLWFDDDLDSAYEWGIKYLDIEIIN